MSVAVVLTQLLEQLTGLPPEYPETGVEGVQPLPLHVFVVVLVVVELTVVWVLVTTVVCPATGSTVMVLTVEGVDVVVTCWKVQVVLPEPELYVQLPAFRLPDPVAVVEPEVCVTAITSPEGFETPPDPFVVDNCTLVLNPEPLPSTQIPPAVGLRVQVLPLQV